MKILSFFLFLLNFIIISPSFAWINFKEMIDEASEATSDEGRYLGNRFRTKEQLIEGLITISPSKAPSPVYEELKEEAIKLIASYTHFFGKGIDWMAPWDSIAGLTLGTDNLRKSLIGFVALADIRGLPSFKITLDRVLAGMKPKDPIESLSDQFRAMKVA